MLGSMSWKSSERRSGRSLTFPLTLIVLVASAMLSSGCAGATVIPDPNIPHQVAAETCVTVWARAPGGEMKRVKVRLLEGWWVASPQVVDPPPSK